MDSMKEDDWWASEVLSVACNKQPSVVFQTDKMVYLREIEDMIAWLYKRLVKSYNYEATRYVCNEKYGNRYYYEVQIMDGESRTLVLCGDATDYSGHGHYDKKLAEYFIEKVLRLRLNEVPASSLIGRLITELYQLKGVK